MSMGGTTFASSMNPLAGNMTNSTTNGGMNEDAHDGIISPEVIIYIIAGTFVFLFVTGCPCWLLYRVCGTSINRTRSQMLGLDSTLQEEEERRQKLREQKKAQRQEMIQKFLIVREWMRGETAPDQSGNMVENQVTKNIPRSLPVLHGDWGTCDENSSSHSAPSRCSSSSDDGSNDHEDDLEAQMPTDAGSATVNSDSTHLEQSQQGHDNNRMTAMNTKSLTTKSMNVSNTTKNNHEDTNDNGDNDDDDTPCCAICWAHFESREWICQSNNSACHHIFHQGCMTGWLLTHEECPICRQVFLIDPRETTTAVTATTAEQDIPTAITTEQGLTVAETGTLIRMGPVAISSPESGAVTPIASQADVVVDDNDNSLVDHSTIGLCQNAELAMDVIRM